MSTLAFLVNNSRWLIGGFLLTFFSSFGQTFFISLSAGDIRSEYELSHGEFGLLYMLATLASALTLPWMGKIVDHYSPAQVSLMIIPMLAMGALGMAFSTHLVLLIGTIYFLRLFGQAMMTQNALTAAARWFAVNRGKAVSYVTLGQNAGEAVFPLIFVIIAASVGWRNTWMISSIFLILIALPVITFLVSKDRLPHSSEAPAEITAVKHWTRGEVLRDKLFWLMMLGILAPPFIGTTIFFHQVYLVEVRGWSLTVFASAFSIMALSTILFVLIAGYLVDRFSAVKLLPIFLIPLALACFVLGGLSAQWSAFIFMALLGISYGFSSTLFGAIWPELYGTEHLGAIRAIIVAMMVFGTAAGPGITGWLIDVGVDYSSQIIAMGLYCLVACVLMQFVSRSLSQRKISTR